MDAYGVDPVGRHVVVIGHSPILGKPVSLLLLGRGATMTIWHSKTTDLPAIVGAADVVVAAVGWPRFVQGNWLRPGTVVIDASYNPRNVGDIDFDSALEKASLITPVPGGVGPITIAVLIDQAVEAAFRLRGTDPQVGLAS